MNRTKTIMMIDDDEDDRYLFEKIFNEINTNIRVTPVESGIDAIELLNQGSKPDLILIDVNMPSMDGYECLDKIRDCNNCSCIPVIMMSTSVVDPLKKGVNRFYRKPSETNQLRKMLEEIIQHTFSKS